MLHPGERYPDVGETNDLIRRAQARVPHSLAQEVAVLSGLSRKDVATLIGLTERFIFKNPTRDFSVLISEHILRLILVFTHGLAVFDQQKKVFTQWLKTPLPELASPLTGFNPEWPASPTPPLSQLGAVQPYDLMAFAAQREKQATVVLMAVEGAYPTPFSLLNTSTGIRLVDDVFTRIEAGVYSQWLFSNLKKNSADLLSVTGLKDHRQEIRQGQIV